MYRQLENGRVVAPQKYSPHLLTIGNEQSEVSPLDSSVDEEDYPSNSQTAVDNDGALETLDFVTDPINDTLYSYGSENVEENPYQKIVAGSDVDRITSVEEDREGWSILSDRPMFPVSSTDSVLFAMQAIPLKGRNFSRAANDETDEIIDESKGPSDESQYRYDAVKSEISLSQSHHEARDVATTYIKTEPAPTVYPDKLSIPLDSTCHTQGVLPNNAKLRVLFDTGATRSYLSKGCYLRNEILHGLPKFSTSSKSVVVGNGAKCPILFAIPIPISLSGHHIEIMCLVTEMSDSTDLVFGIKNMTELEGSIDTATQSFTFRNRSAQLMPDKAFAIAPGQKRNIKIKIPFSEEISALGVAKLYPQEKGRLTMHTVQMKITRNVAMLKVENHTKQEVKFNPKIPIGILDLRSIGYYFTDMETLKKGLRPEYSFKTLQECIDVYNRLAVEIKKAHTLEKANRELKSQMTDDPFPWLDPDDPLRKMTDREILTKHIDLDEANMTEADKAELRDDIWENKEAFSLRGEIGDCPDIEIKIDTLDDSPFFVRPHSIAEQDKPLMDKIMNRQVALGIMSANSTSHTSPVMLVSRKSPNEPKRAVVDFRFLNTRILRRNTATPLMRDIFNILGSAIIEILSVLDIKEAFHSMRLAEASKDLCGILPYFGSQHFRYERMPMGLAISPARWMDYVNHIMRDLEQKNQYIAVMDDMLVFSTRKSHRARLIDLFKMMIKYKLKLSPKKCQLFRKQLVYIGNVFTIKDGKITITPMRSRCEAIQLLPTPTTVTEVKSFCGTANYLSLFCKSLQDTLKPLRVLCKKGNVFHWGKHEDAAFRTVKEMLQKPPILYLPRATGRLVMYSDTSKEHTGSSLWQYQEGKPRLIGYASKTLPKACQNYSATELELTGLAINMASWKQILHRTEFDCAVDHQALIYLYKAKKPPASKRITRLLEILSNYNFNLYYIKGKDLILSDYLSRTSCSKGDPSEVIPISFKLEEVELPEVLLKLESAPEKFNPQDIILRSNAFSEEDTEISDAECEFIEEDDSLCPMTRKEAKARKVKLPEVHGANKPKSVELGPDHKPRQRLPRARPLPTPVPPPILRTQDRPRIPILRQDSRPPSIDIGGPEQEVIESTTRTPRVRDFAIPPSLANEADKKVVMTHYLPRQTDIDRVMDQIDRKILRESHFDVSLKDLEASYLSSKEFRDIYLLLKDNKQPDKKTQRSKLEGQADGYMLLDKLLFKIKPDSEGGQPRLCIPTSKVHLLLDKYHSSLIGAHAGIVKCYQTISEKYYCPNLAHHLRAYITGCHTCQTMKSGEKINRPFHKRVNLTTPSMSHLSMDIKVMPPGIHGFRYILVVICEVTNYIIAKPLKRSNVEEVCEILKNSVFNYFGSPSVIISDQDPVFMSKITQWFFQQCGIKPVIVSPTNHKSLMAEMAIKNLSMALIKLLRDSGANWPNVLSWAMMHHNTYNTPNLDNMSPLHLLLGHKASVFPSTEVGVNTKITGTHKDYYENLARDLRQIRARITALREKRQQLTNKDKTPHGFTVGQIVYLFNPRGAALQSGTRKIKAEWVGPLVIYKPVSPELFLVMSVDGYVYPALVEQTRLKPGSINTSAGKVETLAQLRSVIRTGKLPE